MIDPDSIVTLDKVDDPQFEKDMLLLENDLDAMGWDVPARLYAVIGEPGDYRLELISEMHGHPVDWMRTAVMGSRSENIPGGRLDDRVQGVVAAVEGWRHPTVTDFIKHNPEKWSETLTEAQQELGLDEKEAIKVLNDRLFIVFSQMAPHSNPLRVELRSVMALMRDGRALSLHRDRDCEPEVLSGSGTGRMVEAMQAMLTGCWPKDDYMNTPTEERS